MRRRQPPARRHHLLRRGALRERQGQTREPRYRLHLQQGGLRQRRPLHLSGKLRVPPRGQSLPPADRGGMGSRRIAGMESRKQKLERGQFRIPHARCLQHRQGHARLLRPCGQREGMGQRLGRKFPRHVRHELPGRSRRRRPRRTRAEGRLLLGPRLRTERHRTRGRIHRRGVIARRPHRLQVCFRRHPESRMARRERQRERKHRHAAFQRGHAEILHRNLQHAARLPQRCQREPRLHRLRRRQSIRDRNRRHPGSLPPRYFPRRQARGVLHQARGRLGKIIALRARPQRRRNEPQKARR